jgi:hypothetical protein
MNRTLHHRAERSHATIYALYILAMSRVSVPSLNLALSVVLFHAYQVSTEYLDIFTRQSGSQSSPSDSLKPEPRTFHLDANDAKVDLYHKVIQV